MRNKIRIFLGVLLFGVIVSYIVFGWSEPTGSMPSSYKAPINTSIETQDVDEGKPVITNLDSDKVDGYEASDLLASVGGSANMVVPIASSETPAACPSGWVDFGVISLDAGGHNTRYCYKDSSIDGSPYNLDAAINNPLVPEKSKTITVNFGGSSSTVEISCNSGTLDYLTKQNVVSYTVFNLTNINTSQDLICNVIASNSYGEISTEKTWPKPPVVSSVMTYEDLQNCNRYLTNCQAGYSGDVVSLRDPITYKLKSIYKGDKSEAICGWECFDIANNSLGVHTDNAFPFETVTIKLVQPYYTDETPPICLYNHTFLFNVSD